MERRKAFLIAGFFAALFLILAVGVTARPGLADSEADDGRSSGVAVSAPANETTAISSDQSQARPYRDDDDDDHRGRRGHGDDDDDDDDEDDDDDD